MHQTVLLIGKEQFEITPEYWHFHHYWVSQHGAPIVEVNRTQGWEAKNSILQGDKVALVVAALATWQRAQGACAG